MLNAREEVRRNGMAVEVRKKKPEGLGNQFKARRPGLVLPKHADTYMDTEGFYKSDVICEVKGLSRRHTVCESKRGRRLPREP